MRVRGLIVAVFFLLAGVLSVPVQAFNADGIWSGMSREQVTFTAARLGLRVGVQQGLQGEGGKMVVANPGAPWLDATLGFCGKVLTSYSRNLSSDTDYAAALARVFAQYGPPKLMSFRGDVTTDINSASGAMQSYVVTEWLRGNDRVQLKSFFDWRIQQGNLGRFQPATILYEMRSPCTLR